MPAERLETYRTYGNRPGGEAYARVVFHDLNGERGPLEWDRQYRGFVWNDDTPTERRGFIWTIGHEDHSAGPVVGMPFPVTDYDGYRFDPVVF